MCPLRVFFALLQLHLLFVLGLSGGSAGGSSGASASGATAGKTCPFRSLRRAGSGPSAFVAPAGGPSPAALAAAAATASSSSSLAARVTPAPFTLTVPPVSCRGVA